MRKKLLYKTGVIAGILCFIIPLNTICSVNNILAKTSNTENQKNGEQSISLEDIEQINSIKKRSKEIYDNLLKYTVNIRSGGTGNLVSRGTGVLVSKDGHILTAAHVINSMKEEVFVRLFDGSYHAAVCLGKDELGDYGLLKIKEKGNWEHAKMGSSQNLSKDEACLMLGYPALFKELTPAVLRIGFYRGTNTNGYLQTSCIMMPGDSGGPLFDLNGEIVGICSYIAKPLTRNFYSPIDSIKKNFEKLVNGETFNKREKKENLFIKGESEGAKILNKQFVLEGGKEKLSKIIENNVKQLKQSVVKISSKTSEEEIETHGTIVSSDGYILSKSSRVGERNIYCKFNDGQCINANIIGRDEDNDLVLLKVPQKNLTAVKLDLNINNEVGELLGTLGFNGEVIHSGILGVKARKIPKDRSPEKPNRGYLGANFFMKDSAFIIENVKDGQAAKNAGIIAGDKIININAIPVLSLSDIFNFLTKTKPKQKLSIKILRGDNNEEKEFEVVLGEEPERTEGIHPAKATKISKRKDGFLRVFTHDMPLKLDECGTPVVNLNGEVIGLNIARKNRSCSFAIPISIVKISIETIILKTKILKGSPSPKFVDYENANGSTNSLDDFKGKYVFIDVWGTYCSPCKAEIPYLKKIQERYKGKDIVFVSISVDMATNHDKWIKMVEEMELGGIQLFSDKSFHSDFIKAYGIRGIPHFILIDRNGNIISNDAPRPSNPELIKLLDNLDFEE